MICSQLTSQDTNKADCADRRALPSQLSRYPEQQVEPVWVMTMQANHLPLYQVKGQQAKRVL